MVISSEPNSLRLGHPLALRYFASVQGKRLRLAPSGLETGTSAAEGSGPNPESRPCCLEFLHSRVRDLGADEAQALQAREFFQFLKPCVSDFGIVEFHRPQALEFLQLFEPRVRDLRGYLGSLSLHKIPKREGVTTNPNAG